MTKRCAIYTLVQVEVKEGLEQDFNSLDAQHEACAAYVKSQASEGWKRSVSQGTMMAASPAARTLERPRPAAAPCGHWRRPYRHSRRLQGRPADPRPARFCQAGGGVRQGGRPSASGDVQDPFNPTYLARINHGGRTLNAIFSSIIAQAEWDEEQASVADKIRPVRGPPSAVATARGKPRRLPSGPMVEVHACEGKIRYRYQSVGTCSSRATPAPGRMRLPAR